MIPKEISLGELKRKLSIALKRVEAGETLIITKAGKPLAEIKPVKSRASKKRPFGLCEGEFTVPDDFDSPLPENLIEDFEGK